MDSQENKNYFSEEAVGRLIAAHDGDVALLYLHIAHSGRFDAEAAARDLLKTSSEISSAKEKLDRLFGKTASSSGARTETPAVIVPVREDPPSVLPEYRAEDIISRNRADGVFSGIVLEAARIFGHPISTPDMCKLFGIYDYLGLSPEVIYILINFCNDRSAELYGSSKRITMRSVEKEALIWSEKGITTLDKAEEYIANWRLMHEEKTKFARAIGIKTELTPTQEKYITSWIEKGISADAAAIAYDRTVTNTGKLSWNYMDKIISSWHEKGIRTAKEVQEKDPRGPGSARRQERSGKYGSEDVINLFKD